MAFPPLEFLVEASAASLQDMQLAAANRSANLKKVIRYELEQCIEEEAKANLAEWFLKYRDAILRGEVITVPGPKSADIFDVRDRKKTA